MTDALSLAANEGLLEAQNAQTKSMDDPKHKSATAPLRPATMGEVDLAHAFLMDAINDSPFYSELFKQHETKRLSKQFLRRLITIDPHHVFIVEAKDESGALQPAGVMVTGPEMGTLWLYWTYVSPKYRNAALAMGVFRAAVQHWDKGRFHKVSTYTKPENNTINAIMKRYKFTKTAVLEKHIFGEDYCLCERMLNKVEPGYDSGLDIGTFEKIKQRVLGVIGR